MKALLRLLLLSLFLFPFSLLLAQDSRLKSSSRSDHDGWIQLHLEGSPSEIGYQHGYLLADEIDDAFRMFKSFLKGATDKDWAFYREAADRMFVPKLGDEYRAEMQGIADGLAAKGKHYDLTDLTVLNGWMELAWYYVPWLANQAKADSMNNRAPGNCSAFIATGSFTKDGKIVMAHNTWVEYVVGERWNVAMDIAPAKGHRISMDAFPGFIHSGDDFAINDAGILITETTITGLKSFNWRGTPEFVRARRAEQYASSIDEFVKLMSEDNNGAYGNTWLVGDLKTNEIAKLDLGLKHQHLWRTTDGMYVGANFGTDELLLKEETTFNVADSMNSPNSRRARWNQIMAAFKGKIDAEAAKRFMADHYDVHLGTEANNRCVLCGHADEDPVGIPEWSNGPFYPVGATSGKVTTADMARGMKFWARIGHPCGQDFIVASFMAKHPEYKWMEPGFRDMKAGPWTIVGN